MSSLPTNNFQSPVNLIESKNSEVKFFQEMSFISIYGTDDRFVVGKDRGRPNFRFFLGDC